MGYRPGVTDVARLAGVSDSTVQRALTHPSTLTPATLAKIQAAIDQLGTDPAPGLTNAKAGTTPPTNPPPRPTLTPGTRVRVRRGNITTTGTVDEIMPDKTMLWIWQDNGHGRLLIHPAEDLLSDTE